MVNKNLTIVISNHCNMDTLANGCSYCCIQDRNTSNILTFEEIDSFISSSFVDENEINIIEFFGGEPTIHYDVINKVINKYPNFKYRMYTNGLFDFELWKDILLNFYEILISHDGPGLYNSKRNIGNPNLTNIVEQNIINCINYGINLTVAIVPSTKEHFFNLKYIIDYFRNLNVQSFSLEIPSVIQDSYVNKNFNTDYMNLILKYFYEEVVPNFLNEKDFKNKFLFNLPKEHYPGNFNKNSCSETNLALSPSNKIYHCRDTAANENKIIRTNKVVFFDIKKIKEIEKNYTCHVKKMQGYDYNNIITENNKYLIIAMYHLINSMNAYYNLFVLKQYNICEIILFKVRSIILVLSVYTKLLK